MMVFAAVGWCSVGARACVGMVCVGLAASRGQGNAGEGVGLGGVELTGCPSRDEATGQGVELQSVAVM